jgi:hypothetical protein
LFDPTAFENIKVVIEGEIYDRDLSGEIAVIDRNDWINTAKLSRKYEICFRLEASKAPRLSATMVLEAGLEHLSAELLGHSDHLAGCIASIRFNLQHPDDDDIYKSVQNVLESIWGKGRAIKQAALIPPFETAAMVENKATVSFNRLIYEDQIDDLSEMVQYMVESLKKLKQVIN